MTDTILVTGGAGFIGSALVRRLVRDGAYRVVNVDKLTYAGSLESVQEAAASPGYAFERADICDAGAMRRLMARYRPAAIVHLAAESHVDRSIDAPAAFLQTNVVGTFTLLEAALDHWRGLDAEGRAAFRFVHVSTDEVYGSLGPTGAFTEETAYQPNSPYSASKAAADHLVRAWHQTYGLPVVTTNCSNNYGPYQYPEKLIPLMIQRALAGEPLPVYGRGENVRDWLHVDDHVGALIALLRHGRVGETYNIGGNEECRNIEVVQAICDLLDELRPDPAIGPRRALIAFVADRPGHDLRYAIDASKMQRELGWRPTEAFATGLRRTVEWYLEHQDWCERVQGRAGPWERQGGPIAARLRTMGDDADGPETTLDPADGLTPTATGPTRPF